MAGTAQTSALGVVSWEAEDSLGDSSDDTVTTRVQVRDDMIDVSGLTRELVNRGGTFQRLAEGDMDQPGAFGLSQFTTTFYLEGHGGTTAGSLTQTDLNKLLAHAVGNVHVAQQGTTVDTPTDADTFTVAGGSLVAGGLIRVGALGDARGDGQFAAVDNASTVQLYTAMGAAPNASDVVYASQLVYPVSSVASGGIVTSDGSTNNNTLRFLLQTANLAFVCRGCVATGVTFELGAGTLPRVSITWSTIAWNPVSATFPSASAAASKGPSPIVNGSTFIQTKGTTTRSTDVVHDFAMSWDTNMLPLYGGGGENAGQNVVGWRRGPHRTTVSFSVEAQAVTASPTWHDYFATSSQAQTAKSILWTGSVVDGSAIGIWLPNCKPVGSVPTQADIDGLNRVPLTFEAMTNTVTTSELTLANWVLAQG